MKKLIPIIFKRLTLVFILIAGIVTLSSWGFYAHFRINRFAVYLLPKGMAPFYKANIYFITAHGISADRKRYEDSTEAPHHFFNADHYGRKPFVTVPHKWAEATKKYSQDTIIKYGTLPWTIQYQYYKLVSAFKGHDTTGILRTSANLGHYVADACVPLHLSSNYNGQLTNQTGLHALWESRIPELFGNQYHLYPGKIKYIEDPLSQAFIICRGSFKCVDSVLRIEKAISKAFKEKDKYEIVVKGNRKVKEYSTAYCKAYQHALKAMVERRMRFAIKMAASYWYSAWVDAGQPNLNKIIDKPLTDAEKRQIAHEELYFKSNRPVVLTEDFLKEKQEPARR